MKFDDLYNKLLKEADIESLAKQDSREAYEDELDKKEAYKNNLLRKDEEPINDDFVDMIESMPTDQLISLYIEDLHALYTGGLFDRHDSDRAKQQINTIKQELLSRGESEEKLNTIEDDIKEEIIADEEGDNY